MALKMKHRKSKDPLRDVNALGNLMIQVSDMLQLSMEQRDLALSQLHRAQDQFEQVDTVYRAELAELPPDLDAYLRLVRDKKRLEQRQRALEAQSLTSHALNFHLGNNPTWNSGPTIMDELRAEEAELDRQALEDEQRQAEMEQSIIDTIEEEDSIRRKTRRKKKSNSDKGNRVRVRTEAEAEAHMKFNLRDGLFAHLDAGLIKEAELEARVQAALEGTKERLEAETELNRFRNKQSNEIAEFFDEYNPKRIQRGKEESLSALGLYLPDPTEIVASVEEETLNGTYLGDDINGEQNGEIDSDDEYVLMNEQKLGIPPLVKPKYSSQIPSTTAEGILNGTNKRSMEPTQPKRIIPGFGISQKMSDSVVNDPLHGRSILDLPTNLSSSSSTTPRQISALDKHGSKKITSPTPTKNGEQQDYSENNELMIDEVHGDIRDIRGTVLQNTSAMDLTFPSLEFRRKKGDEKNTYFEPGVAPPVYKVSQSDGAVWSAMARERRELEAIERNKIIEGNNVTKPKKKLKKKKKKTSLKNRLNLVDNGAVETNDDMFEKANDDDGKYDN